MDHGKQLSIRVLLQIVDMITVHGRIAFRQPPRTAVQCYPEQIRTELRRLQRVQAPFEDMIMVPDRTIHRQRKAHGHLHLLDVQMAYPINQAVVQKWRVPQ